VKVALIVEEDIMALPVAPVDREDALEHLEKPRSWKG
jgi:hypothetical protein